MSDFAINPNGTSGVSLFAGGATFGLLKSTDDGATWVANNIDDGEVNSLGVVPNGSGGTNVIVGAYSGMFVSTNDGGSWQHVEPNFMALDYVVTPSGPGGHNIFGGGFNGVWLSTNGGLTWAHSGLGEIVSGMAATGNGANVFAGGDPFGVYRSTNNGATWTLVNNGLTDLRIFALLSPDGTNLFAAGSGGVYLSTDHGNSWTSVGTGLTTGVFSLAVSADGSTLLAGTTGFGVWKRPLSEMIQVVGVGGNGALMPREITLNANHPNPFNMGTTIQYSLPRAMPVLLVVHDVTGRTVRTLVDGIQDAGHRHVIWDGRDESGSRVSPGMYVCRLDADGARMSRRMTHLK